MPQTVETALVVIAVALVAQTLIVAAAAIGTWRVLRDLRQTVRVEYDVLRARMDEALRHVQSTSAAVTRLSTDAGAVAHHAGQVIDEVSGAARTAVALVAAPRAWLAASAATGLRALLRRWPRAHRAH